ncbi:1-phosphatidylinositol 4,5-bisphosphate phosphodiesterase beta-3-like isoform X5 [Apostichopus japonicus]|uniref:1-phosphatidylinositol 4,5-bisphosphate phosphodiesterase beta-3-like isoform X5 n=1 Tax=Stichopus japonicus TaxID=307972 RepID=UPI003AB2A1D5
MVRADTAKVKAGFENIVVPEELTRGGKFIKWEQDPTSVIPVTLKVDPKGYFLYWKDQKKASKADGTSREKQPDVDCLELAHLRDARNGKYAVVPKDAKTRDICFMGAQDETLEMNAVTVVKGADMVNITFVTFFSNNSKMAEQWSNELIRIAYSRANRTPSKFQLLEKMYVKLTILVNREGRIPVKTLKKMLANSRDDKKRIDDVLQASNIHPQEGCIDPKKFTFNNFFTFYLRLVHERDVDRVFQELGAKNKPYLTKEQIVKFLNDGQRDPRLNEILYPYHTEQDAVKLIKKYEQNQAFARKGHLSSEGLAHYLMSHENSVIPPESYILWQDMDHPLCQYFINSSHNTYLIGHQFTGKSSVEIYRQVLLAGCRCVELDCWDGQEDEPMITHGYTMCTDISFKEVVEAINETAFKTSDYPVILSFENHCTPKVQAKMAHYCRTIFGDKLLVDPLDDYPLEKGQPLPTPTDLRGKILIKNRKQKTDPHKKRSGNSTGKSGSKAVADQTKNQKAVSGWSKNWVPGDNRPMSVFIEQQEDPKGVVLLSSTWDSSTFRVRRFSSQSSVSSADSVEDAILEPSKINKGAVKRVSKRSKLVQISEVVYDEDDIPQEILAGTAKSKISSASLQSAASSDSQPGGNQASSTEAPKSKTSTTSQPSFSSISETTAGDSEAAKSPSVDLEKEGGALGLNGDRKLPEPVEEEESDSDDDETDKGEVKKEQGTAGQEAEAGAEMSALVNYLQPVHFHSFDNADKANKSYEITSFVETSAMNKVKEKPTEFVRYNKRQLSRIYPRGTRVDSSNYMPQIFWNVGCQLVALNFQSLDLPMQLNLGIFELNGGCGFILKPDFMRRKERDFDPFAESTMDGVVAATLEMKVISGQFLSDKRIGSYVEIDLYGLPHDTVRKKHRTKVVSANGLNPLYDDKAFKFDKIIMPKLAMLRISVYESNNNRMIGHRILPVETLRPGYRHVCLRNESNQVLMLPSLFVHIKVGDYVPSGLAGFADALSNPIAHISEIDKRARMLEELAADTYIIESPDPEPGNDTPQDITQEDGPVTEEATPAAAAPAQAPDHVTSSASASATATPVTNRSTPSYVKKTTSEGSFGGSTPRKVSKIPLNPKISSISAISVDSSISLGRDSSYGLARSASLGNTQFEVFNGAFSNNSRSVSAPNLNPSEEIEAATVDDIKQHKKYLKLTQQHSNQLDKLIKKQEKKQSKLKKTQAKEMNKLKTMQMKGVKGLEKKNSTQEKKETKKKNGDDSSENVGDVEKVRRQSISSLESMKKEQEEEILKKQVHHEDILIELYRKHYEEEKQLRFVHANQRYELEQLLMEKVHSKQLKALDKQQKKEEGDLRKMMEKHNLDQRRNISSANGDHHEIQRVRDEAKKKHIGQTVQFTKELRMRHVDKKDELQKKMIELQELLSTDCDKFVEKLEKEFDDRFEKLVQERRYQRLVSNGNGTAHEENAQPVTKDQSKDTNGVKDDPGKGNVGEPSKDGETIHAVVHAGPQSPTKEANTLPSKGGASSPSKSSSGSPSKIIKENGEGCKRVNGINPEDGSSDTLIQCSEGDAQKESQMAGPNTGRQM